MNLMFKGFFLKKKEIVTNLKDLRVLWISPVLIRVFESIYYRVLMKEIEWYINKEYRWQFGFITGYSTLDVLDYMNDINLGEGELILALDLAKAFDSVPHSILLEKLENNNILKEIGVYTIIKIWLYLLSKSCYTVNGVKWENNVGLPMGLRFSPIVFNLYFFFVIKELKVEIRRRLISYADDTTVILKKKDCYNDVVHIEDTFKKFNIRINREKSIVAYIKEKKEDEEEIKKVLNLGYIKKDQIKILGKKFIMEEILDSKIDTDGKQLEDLFKFNVIRLYKFPYRILYKITQAFIIGKVRYHFMVSNGFKKGDVLLRNDFMEGIRKFFEKLTYINLFWAEKVLIYLKFGTVKAITSSIRNENYKNIISSNYREREDLFNNINNRIIEWTNNNLDKKVIIELMEEIVKDFKKKGNNLNMFVKILKKKLNKEIEKEIYMLLEKEILINKNLEIEIKEIFDNNIMLNKIFWLSTRKFYSNNSNKRFLNNEGFILLNYLQNIVDMVKIDFKKEKKLGDIKLYMENAKIMKQNLGTYMELKMKKENKEIMIFKPFKDIIILNKEIKKEIKDIKLKLIKIKDDKIMLYYEEVMKNLKDILYYLKWILMIMDKVAEYIFSRKEKLEEIEVLMIINKTIMEEDEMIYMALDLELEEEEEYQEEKDKWLQMLRMHNMFINVGQ